MAFTPDADRIGTMVYDGEGRIVACDPDAAALLGRRREDLLSLAPGDQIRGVLDEDGYPLPKAALAPLAANAPPSTCVVGVRERAGGMRWVRIDSAGRADAANGAAGRVCHLRDITAACRREAEQTLIYELLRAALNPQGATPQQELVAA